MYNWQDILKALPHRYPFLLVDKVLEMQAGKYIKALKNVTINEPAFEGHFPDRPVMPGVLVVEALAQASGFLAHHSEKEFGLIQQQGYLYMFAGIDNVRFKRSVIPGDQLILESNYVKHKSNIFKFAAIAKVNNIVVCQADLTCAYTKYGD